MIQKEASNTKYSSVESKQFLAEIRSKYNEWRDANLVLKGPLKDATSNDSNIIVERVRLFSKYKEFIDKQKYAEHFDSRSNLHSSVLEEFIYYLFRDITHDFSEKALIGKAHTFKDVFFMPRNFSEMVTKACCRIEKKDHDFAIGTNIKAVLSVEGSSNNESHLLQIPAIAIECKTYLDKTMLEGASSAAEQLKTRNPNALYIVVTEWLKLTEAVNLRKYKVDQIYVLRKQKNTDREFRYLKTYQKSPIYPEVVEHLFEAVRNHLVNDWEGGLSHGLERGYLL